MNQGPANLVLRYIRKWAGSAPSIELTDRELLSRFLLRRDEDAFAALVERHGGMVFRVCRRVLRDCHGAEDAFQATFLVLIRKARTIGNRELVAGWLYRVAYRVAMRMRARGKSQGCGEERGRSQNRTDPVEIASARELCAILDGELNRLPTRYRDPFLLCHVEGRSRDEAARDLGLSVRTLQRRLEKGRELLQNRLLRRGVTLSGALVAAGLSQTSSAAAVPSLLAAATVRAAVSLASEGAPALTGTTALALALAESGVKATAATRLALLMCAALSAALAGGGLLAYQVGTARQAAEKPQTPAAASSNGAAAPGRPDAEGPRTDLHGDPLPDGALARLGTTQRRAIDTTLAITADGKSIVGIRGGRHVNVWDFESGALRKTMEIAGEGYETVALSQDGRHLANVVKGALTVWELQGEKFVHRLTLCRNAGGATFSANGQRIAAMQSGHPKFSVHVWDISTGQEIFAKDVTSNGGPGQLSFSPDGTHLLASFTSTENGMYCWDINTGRLVWQNKEYIPQFMSFTPDGRILSSAQRYPVLDLATGKAGVSVPLPPHEWHNRLTVAGGGELLLVSDAGEVRIWDLVHGKALRTLKGAGEQVVVAPDGKTILTNKGLLQRWDLATGKAFYPDNSADGHVDEVTLLRFSADGKYLVSGSKDGTVRLWEVAAGRPLRVWAGHASRRPVRVWPFWGAGIDCLDITPAGARVVSAGSEGSVKVWDAVSGTEFRSIALPDLGPGEDNCHVYGLRVSSDGAAATALFGPGGFNMSIGDPRVEHHNHIETWDLNTGKLLNHREVSLNCTVLSPDGNVLLSGLGLIHAGTSKEWCRLERSLAGNRWGMPQVFSRDGRLLAGEVQQETKKDGVTYTSTAGLCVWEALSGKIVVNLPGKFGASQIAFLADNCLVAATEGTHVRLHDLAAGKVIFTRRMPQPIGRTDWTGGSAFTFSPDGRQLATGHTDGTILLWNTDLPSTRVAALSPTELESLWEELSSADAGKAWRAIWRMSDSPKEAVTFLGPRLKPVLPAPEEQTRILLSELDSDSFPRREAAAERLRSLGHRAETAMRAALKNSPSLETKRRLEAVLASLQGAPPLPQTFQQLRAVVVLERIGSREARQVLVKLAKGVPSDQLTLDAKASLERLDRRPK